jgi:methionyl-tRNA formyltransferase
MGTPDFAVASLDAIVKAGYDVAAVVTVPDRQTGRGLKVTFSPVKEYALQHSIPLLQPEKLRDPNFLDALKAIGADLFVVVAFRMLPQVVWAMPPLGTFNLHASLLPQYRGAAPINWAIINGEKETGVTTFLLNEKIDEGKVLMQRHTPINDNDTAETLHDRLAEMGAKLTVETLEALFEGTIEPKPQTIPDTLKAAPKIFKQDCAIDWRRDGKYIVNFVRGLSPYPAATTTMTDTKGENISMKIFATEFEKAENSIAGEIKSDGKKMLKIGVNDGFIKILSLQISGKKKISVDEFLRGYNVSDWKLNV